MWIRIAYASRDPLRHIPTLRNDRMSPLFMAAIEATEEAIVNSLFHAHTMVGRDGHHVEALPVAKVLAILARYRHANEGGR